MCRECRANPVAIEGYCAPCWRDRATPPAPQRPARGRWAVRQPTYPTPYGEARKPGTIGRDRALLRRVLKAITILLVAVPLVKPLNAEPVRIEGRVDCAKWLKGRVEPIGAVIVQAYLIGTLNGIAFGERIDFWRMRGGISQDQAVLWMDNYCRANPLSTVMRGAAALFDEHTGGVRLLRP